MGRHPSSSSLASHSWALFCGHAGRNRPRHDPDGGRPPPTGPYLMALEGDVRMHEGRRDIMVDVGGTALTRTYGWYADNTGFASRSLDQPTCTGTLAPTMTLRRAQLIHIHRLSVRHAHTGPLLVCKNRKAGNCLHAQICFSTSKVQRNGNFQPCRTNS